MIWKIAGVLVLILVVAGAYMFMPIGSPSAKRIELGIR